MHSSRMRTGCSLTVSQGRGVCLPGGGLLPEGISQSCTARQNPPPRTESQHALRKPPPLHYPGPTSLQPVIRSERFIFTSSNFRDFDQKHSCQAMTEYRGRGLSLNLKLDPSPLCPNELQRKKLTTHCT